MRQRHFISSSRSLEVERIASCREWEEAREKVDLLQNVHHESKFKSLAQPSLCSCEFTACSWCEFTSRIRPLEMVIRSEVRSIHSLHL